MLCILVSKEYITQINYKYRSKFSATDVITFSYANIQVEKNKKKFSINKLYLEHSSLLGEIYICHETAKKQAKEKKITLLQETIILLVHGIFHSFGLDHENSDEEEKFMEEQEKKTLRELDIFTKYNF